MRTLLGIVTRNRSDILPKAIESALAQSARDVGIAIIDDGSTDKTDDLRRKYPTVAWLRRNSQLGLVSARNEFMMREPYEFFVSLDDDAWFLTGDEIEVALAHLDKDPNLAGVAFDILSPDQPAIALRGPAVSVGLYIGCGHVLRLSAVRKVGAYVPTPGGYGAEEKDLSLRLIDSGYRLVRLPGVHVWHDKTPVERDLVLQHRSGVCNDLTMVIRRVPLLFMPIFLVLKIIRHFAFSYRAGLVVPCLSGMLLFARSLPMVWRWRKPVRLGTLRAFARLTRV